MFVVADPMTDLADALRLEQIAIRLFDEPAQAVGLGARRFRFRFGAPQLLGGAGEIGGLPFEARPFLPSPRPSRAARGRHPLPAQRAPSTAG
jgi:hypothetical protein